MPRRPAGRRGARGRAAARRRARAVADRAEHARSRGGRRPRSAGCSNAIGRPRRVGAGRARIRSRRCRWCGSSRCPPRAQDLDQLIRWQVRKAAPFPIEEAQVSYVPGAAAADGQEFVVVAGAARRRRGVRSAVRRGRRARRASSTSRPSTSSTRCSPGRRRRRATGCWSTSPPTTRRSRSCAAPHLIFFRNRGADTDGTLADLVHQTAMYYEDRLSGAGFARVLLAGAAGGGAARATTSSRCAAASRSGCGPRSKPSIRAPPSTLTDRITAAPALLDTLAPLVGLLLRGQGERPRDPRRTCRRGRSTTSARCSSGCSCSRLVVAAATVFNVVAHAAAIRGATRSWRPRRRATRRAPRSCAQQAAQLRASVDPQQIDAASVEARQANELIDRRTFSWTELFNRFETTLPRRRADHVGAADASTRARHRARRSPSSRAASTTSNEFMENLEDDRRLRELLSRERTRSTTQGQLEPPSRPCYAPEARRKPARPRQRAGRDEARAMTPAAQAHPRREARA